MHGYKSIYLLDRRTFRRYFHILQISLPMLDGTDREIVKVLQDGEASATDAAEEFDLSVSTAHRHLQSLEEAGYVRRSGTRSGETRPYELYAVEETASVFSLQDGRVVERTLDPGGVQKLLLSILEVPQEVFHLPLLSYLVDPPAELDDVAAVAVYGPVARGDAIPGSDVDLLFVTGDEDAEIPDAHEVVPARFEERARRSAEEDERESERERESADADSRQSEDDRRWVVTADSFTEEELREGVERGDEPVRSAVSESIVLYDPDGILRDAKAEGKE